MELKKHIGKTFLHQTMVQVFVDSVVQGSRTQLNVTVTDKGKGWDEQSQSYKGHTNSVGWMRGENKDFGNKDICHKNELTFKQS